MITQDENGKWVDPIRELTGKEPARSAPRTIPEHIVALAQKGDFLVVERTDRPSLDCNYRHIALTGKTLNEKELIEMAIGISSVRKVKNPVIDSTDCAIRIIEGGGWIVLKFMD